MRNSIETDVVVVGSGPGGAGVARDLAREGKRVHILEKGPDVAATGGSWSGALRHAGGPLGALSLRAGLLLTQEWLLVLRGVTTGGSSMVYLGTAYDPDPDMWRPFGFDLQAEAQERKEELGVAPLPDRLLGQGVRDIGETARELGYSWETLPKFIKADKCPEGCNVCMYGCHHGAKWHARDWVLDAVNDGAQLVNECSCEQVLSENGKAIGVRTRLKDGSETDVLAQKIVIAAGGLGSPLILRASGITAAGQSFFFDPFVMTCGVFERDLGMGPMMCAGMHLKEEGIMMTDMQYPPVAFAFQGLGAGRLSSVWQYRRTMPIMTKIRDDMVGSLDSRGKLNKTLTSDDRHKLETGKRIAREILEAGGAKDIWHTRIGAAHPGGTCAMGSIVDAKLETELANCFVCDASVVPVPFGIPPTLTCLALSKRLSSHLLAELS